MNTTGPTHSRSQLDCGALCQSIIWRNPMFELTLKLKLSYKQAERIITVLLMLFLS